MTWVGAKSREGGVDQVRGRRSMPFDDARGRAVAGSDLAPAGGEIVDDQDLVALRQLMLDQVRAEAAGAAGDQEPHRALLAPRRCV